MLIRDIHIREERDFRAKLLEAAIDRLSVADSLDAIISIVGSTARSACSADGVTFVLRDGDKCHYVEEDAIGPLWKGQKFPIATCISGWAMTNQKTAAISDVFVDDRIPHDVYRKTFVKSLVIVPVGGDSSIAAMGAYWREKHAFTDRDIAAIEMLGASISGAMLRLAA